MSGEGSRQSIWKVSFSLFFSSSFLFYSSFSFSFFPFFGLSLVGPLAPGPLFYWWADLPSRVGQSGINNFYFFLFSGSKNYPKNMKISKKKKNQTFLAEKNWENVLTYFQTFSAKPFLDCGQKMADFTRFWKN